MKPVKLIAMDMDGTLLTNRRISPANMAALRSAVDAGIEIALASGRLPDDISFWAKDVGLPFHVISLNGNCLLDGPFGKPIENHFMPTESALYIHQLALESGLMHAIFRWDELAISWIQPPEDLEHWGSHLRRNGGRQALRFGQAAGDRLIRRGCNKIVIIDHSGDPSKLNKIRDLVRANCPDIEITASGATNIELNRVGITKGTALTTLAAHLGIPMSQVMALGDSDNDLPMIQAAGYGVAMGNANAVVKAAARYETLHHAQDGVAAAIRALALHDPNVILPRISEI